jgi:hypothetical protein
MRNHATINTPERLLLDNSISSSTILRALVSVDCVIIKFDEGRLYTFINKGVTSSWSLPGRLMQSDENSSDTAAKLVHQITGKHKMYLQQVFAFTDAASYCANPVISITYVALINDAPTSSINSKDAWFPISGLPPLDMPHQEKIREAMTAVKHKAAYEPVCFDLLPEKFTLPQLRRLYEEIYGENFDQRNFNRKFNELGVLSKLNEKETSQSKKGAFYYTFNKHKYYQMERPGLKFAHLLY